jgi:2-oxoglutarate ferredoxin oxidoreductase subunit beta
MVREVQIFKGKLKPTWCPGCGDFGLLNSLYLAFVRCDLDPDNMAIVSGIGCSSRLPGFVSAYGLHGLHGRALPIAQGVKLADPKIEVIAVGGDGDAFAIGGGHFPHAARRNIDLTYIVMDNRIYGLTKGQVAPTSDRNFHTVSSPYGNLENPISPTDFALSVGTTFVARGFSGKPDQLTEILVEAINHRGFAFVDVLSPCVTFNKVNTFKYFQERVVQLPEGYQSNRRHAALELVETEGDKIHLGILYREERPSYQDLLDQMVSSIPKATPRELILAQK